MKKLNVHAAPRRAVPPPYRPAPREHLIVFMIKKAQMVRGQKGGVITQV